MVPVVVAGFRGTLTHDEGNRFRLPHMPGMLPHMKWNVELEGNETTKRNDAAGLRKSRKS